MDDREVLLAKIANLEGKLKECTKILEQVEWGGFESYDPYSGGVSVCPLCAMEEREKHEPGCALEAALRNLKNSDRAEEGKP